MCLHNSYASVLPLQNKHFHQMLHDYYCGRSNLYCWMLLKHKELATWLLCTLFRHIVFLNGETGARDVFLHSTHVISKLSGLLKLSRYISLSSCQRQEYMRNSCCLTPHLPKGLFNVSFLLIVYLKPTDNELIVNIFFLHVRWIYVLTVNTIFLYFMTLCEL